MLVGGRVYWVNPYLFQVESQILLDNSIFSTLLHFIAFFQIPCWWNRQLTFFKANHHFPSFIMVNLKYNLATQNLIVSYNILHRFMTLWSFSTNLTSISSKLPPNIACLFHNDAWFEITHKNLWSIPLHYEVDQLENPLFPTLVLICFSAD
jgi:hypothetical protein